jgi:hypothetical protein
MTRARELGTHYAGRVGEAEYGVTTLAGGTRSGRDYRTTPCGQCPWRSDVPTGVFPAEAFRHSASTSYDMAQNTFACHMAGKGKPLTCAGFLLRGSTHNLAVRLALIQRRLDLRTVNDGGHPLFTNYRAMAEANGVAPEDPALAPCRDDQ